MIRNVVDEAVLADEVGRRLLRRRRAPPRRLRRLGARGRARRHRRPHRAHPARLRGHGAQLRRPGARLPALRHARRGLERPGRGHPRPRLVHRVVPAVRLRPRRSTRSCSRRSWTCSPRCSTQASPVTWRGTTRAPLDRPARLPADEHGRLTTWIGVGGSPESVVRAARYGLPLMLAIIGGDPRALRARTSTSTTARSSELGQPTAAGRRALARPRRRHRRAGARGALAALPARCATASAPSAAGRRRAAREFDREVGPDGSLYVGSPETVAAQDRRRRCSALGLSRFDLKYSAGTLPHEQADAQHRALRHARSCPGCASCSPRRARPLASGLGDDRRMSRHEVHGARLSMPPVFLALAMASVVAVAACGGGGGTEKSAPAAAAAPTDTADGPGVIAGTITFDGAPPAARPLQMDSDPKCMPAAGRDVRAPRRRRRQRHPERVRVREGRPRHAHLRRCRRRR